MNELNKIYEINEQNMLETLKMKIRNFENTKYQGYLFFINYKGSHFDSFDENPGVRSVKSEFKKILKSGDCKEWIRMVKGFYYTKKQKESDGKKLSQNAQLCWKY